MCIRVAVNSRLDLLIDWEAVFADDEVSHLLKKQHKKIKEKNTIRIQLCDV